MGIAGPIAGTPESRVGQAHVSGLRASWSWDFRKVLFMKLFACILGVLFTLSFAPTAKASSFTLNCPQGGGTCNGNFGTVTLTQNGSNVDVSVTLFSPADFVTTGSHHAFAFNITGSPAISVSGLTSGYTAGGASSNPGYGNYGYTIDCTGCGSGGSGPIGSSLSFTVAKSGGGTLLVTDFATNSGGYSFSADILLNGATGVVASDGDPQKAPTTPEPTSAALVVSGLCGVAWFAKIRQAI